MKKNLLKRGIAVAAAISLLFADTANAGVWYQRSGSWFVKGFKRMVSGREKRLVLSGTVSGWNLSWSSACRLASPGKGLVFPESRS